ncbi:DNA topoisomerase 3 [Novosphingobium terrae]|uniref:DNA topoisomerase 3 n=1 Tax=Novosphingobium terrae TaxID=2726189 RepID=UPI00197F5354|nr:DNA topoisomerase 3 [Novosphingobium terrae]
MSGEILVIAEKPELARAIADALGGGARKEGYIDCGRYAVAWLFGHMLELVTPDTPWVMDDLPISFVPWEKRPSRDKIKQLKIIKSLMQTASSIIHAGDPDEEGQLLVDEVLEWAGTRLPVERVLINDNNPKVIQRAFAGLRPNSDFAGMSAAAEARSVGDLLYGVNMTRAYTLAAQVKGYDGVLSVGRVQTPILGLVVRRDRAHASHTKAYYYTVVGDFEVAGIAFQARYQLRDGDPVDDKKRLADPAFARAIADQASGKGARISSCVTAAKTEPAPLPYNLLKLQMDAARKHGLKPDQVKEITQTLREKHRLITYNRSDCQYLSDEQHADAPGVLAAISATIPATAALIERADAAVKGRAFDSSKVTAHHAIIPTETVADFASLSANERKIYAMIAQAYIAQFYPHHAYDQTKLDVSVEGLTFSTSGKVTTRAGWKSLYRAEDLQEENDEEQTAAQDLRDLKSGGEGQCTLARHIQNETKPAPLYTMATLLADLTRVARYIRNERLRELLESRDKDKKGEHGGIGTPATRDVIIATLFQRGFLTERGKNIVSTPAARNFYDALPDQAKFPDMTALWHEQQKAITEGRSSVRQFVEGIAKYVAGEIETLKSSGLQFQVEHIPCPQCALPLRRIAGKKGAFWSCSGRDKGCSYTADDKRGKPVPRAAPEPVSELHKCMSCGSGLRRKPSSKNKLQFWWACSGYPTCRQTYTDKAGKPDYSTGKTTTSTPPPKP